MAEGWIGTRPGEPGEAPPVNPHTRLDMHERQEAALRHKHFKTPRDIRRLDWHRLRIKELRAEIDSKKPGSP